MQDIKGENVRFPPKIGFLLGTRKIRLPVPYFALGETVGLKRNKVIYMRGWGSFNVKLNTWNIAFSAMLSVFEPPEMKEELKDTVLSQTNFSNRLKPWNW